MILPDMVVDKEFEKAFQLCQYSAQYLHECNSFVSQRGATYVYTRDALLEQQQLHSQTLEDQVRTHACIHTTYKGICIMLIVRG